MINKIINILGNYKAKKMSDSIDKILQNKWKELEDKDKDKSDFKMFVDHRDRLIDVMTNVDAINDFSREYENYIREVNKKKAFLTEEQVDEIMSSIYRKWTFVMCIILNMDASDPIVFSFVNNALVEIMRDK